MPPIGVLLYDLSSRVDCEGELRCIVRNPKGRILQIDARTDVVRDYSDAFAELGPALATSDVDLAVLFAEPTDDGIRIFHDESVAAVASRDTEIAGQGFCARIDYDLIGHGVAHDRANKPRRAVLK